MLPVSTRCNVLSILSHITVTASYRESLPACVTTHFAYTAVPHLHTRFRRQSQPHLCLGAPHHHISQQQTVQLIYPGLVTTVVQLAREVPSTTTTAAASGLALRYAVLATKLVIAP